MYNGKAIYNPSGKAGEYSYWAVNFYNGCSARCQYCYNRKGIVAKVLGGDKPTLKKCLGTEEKAKQIFFEEMHANFPDLRKHGLFFNFVSDPCLPETFGLNFYCIRRCIEVGIPVKVLTKQTWWIDTFLKMRGFFDERYIAIGFTLTGHDELEPGAATNYERIQAMKRLHSTGYKTWASIEPIIDLEASFDMIEKTHEFCHLYKIGLKSGGKYDKKEVAKFIDGVLLAFSVIKTPIYFKDSILNYANISRESLSSNCVDRNFKL